MVYCEELCALPGLPLFSLRPPASAQDEMACGDDVTYRGCRSTVAWELPGSALAFLDKRLYTVPQVHYRDETDICGLVARGGLLITDNPIKVFPPASSRRYRPRAGDPLHGVRTPFPCACRRDRTVTR